MILMDPVQFSKRLALLREFFPDVTEEFLEVQLKEVGELERLAEWLYDERNFAALPRRPDNDFTMDEEEEDEEDRLEAQINRLESTSPDNTPIDPKLYPQLAEMFGTWAEYDRQNYFDQNFQLDLEHAQKMLNPDYYDHAAFLLLLDDFRWFSKSAIRTVLNDNRRRYGLAYHTMREGLKLLKQPISRYRGIPVPLQIPQTQGPPIVDQCLSLDVLVKARITSQWLAGRPIVHPRLLKEVTWVRAKPIRDAEKQRRQDEAAKLQTELKKLRKLRISEARKKGELIECLFCCNETPKYLMFECPGDSPHQMCRICLRTYAMKHGFKDKLVCLNATCQAELTRGVLSKALRRKELRQLDEATEMKLRELMLKICKTIETCKHCGAFMDMGRVSLRENHVFKCPRCTKETCRVCGCDWAGHFGINCRLMAEEARRHRQRDLEDKMAMATIRNCPKCNVAIVKGDGCNNVHCNCGNGMCYICRQDIHFISYNHFCVHLRSLDGPQSCDKCTKCLLYGDYRLKDTEMIEKLRQTLEKEEAKAQAYLEKRIQEMEGKDRATKLRASVRVNTTRN